MLVCMIHRSFIRMYVCLFVCMYVGRLVCEPDALWSEYEEKKLSRTGDSRLLHFCGHFMKHLCA